PGKPGTRVSKSNDVPPLDETASPCQASFETPRVRTSLTPTAMTFAFAGWTAMDGSFCCSTSVGGVVDPKGSVAMMSWAVTRASDPAAAPEEPAASTATASVASPETEAEAPQ